MKIIKTGLMFGVFAALVWWGVLVVHASVPNQLSYQGKHVDSNGIPMNGNYIVTFTIYNGPNTGETALWTEMYTGVSLIPYVVVSESHFSLSLGSVSQLTKSVFQTPLTYLVGQISSDDEMTPQIQLLTTLCTVHMADGLAFEGLATNIFLCPDVENSLTTVERFTVLPSGAEDTRIFSFGTRNVTWFLGKDANQIKNVEQIWSRPTPEGDICFLNTKVGINDQYPNYQLDMSGNMRITSKVLIGTSLSSTEKLTVVGDVKVDGFIGSGANGLIPRIELNKNEKLNGTKYPIELAGCVWVQVNKEGWAIKPGGCINNLIAFRGGDESKRKKQSRGGCDRQGDVGRQKWHSLGVG